MNMKKWFADAIGSSMQPLPLLSFPSVQLLGINVRQLIASADAQAEGMLAVANRVKASAAVSLMDLSVEAEAFGATIHITDDEVPTVVGQMITTQEEADALVAPEVGAGRTGICVDAIRKAKTLITDRPLFAGVIGPFSLAGRLLDVTEAMILCYEDEDLVHTVLTTATDFLIEYCKAFRDAGADGVVIAEPLAGLISPSLAREFSHSYVRKMIDAVQTEDFAVVYHNCGNNTVLMAADIYGLGAYGYHFGDAIELLDLLEKAPADVLVMGNISPSACFLQGTPEQMTKAVQDLKAKCGHFPNFLLSSGCDIPPAAKWDNIDAFFNS